MLILSSPSCLPTPCSSFLLVLTTCADLPSYSLCWFYSLNRAVSQLPVFVFSALRAVSPLPVLSRCCFPYYLCRSTYSLCWFFFLSVLHPHCLCSFSLHPCCFPLPVVFHTRYAGLPTPCVGSVSIPCFLPLPVLFVSTPRALPTPCSFSFVIVFPTTCADLPHALCWFLLCYIPTTCVRSLLSPCSLPTTCSLFVTSQRRLSFPSAPLFTLFMPFFPAYTIYLLYNLY